MNMLLDFGADINAVNNDGDTAMHGAAYNIYPVSWSFWPSVGPIRKSGRIPTSLAGHHYSSPRATPAVSHVPINRRSKL